MLKLDMFRQLSEVVIFALAFSSVCGASPIAFRSIANIKRSFSDIDESYDYVIIGGGQSGLTVADRLTEDPTKKVLVIEYGYLDGDDPRILRPSSGSVPADFVFSFNSIPQPALNNRTPSIVAGAVVGGGSTVNGMFFDRGAAEDYDNWALLGNKGWDWKGLLPYFQKSVTFTPPIEQLQKEFGITFDKDAYGTGPIHASYPPWQWPGQKVQWKSWLELGVQPSKEVNYGDAFGLVWIPSAQDPVSQTRSFARIGHYDRVSKRSNYHLLVGHKVLNITFSDDFRASGVTFQDRKSMNGSSRSVKAAKEVILAAGALHSPQILQRSGIGPKSLLESAGIQTKVDLPGVGQNFQDHPYMAFAFSYTSDVVPNPTMMVPGNAFYEAAQAEYTQNRTGPATHGLGNSGIFATLQTVTDTWQDIVTEESLVDVTKDLPTWFDTTLVEGYKAQHKILLKSLTSKKSAIMESPFAGRAGGLDVLLKPFSRGSVNLNPKDPYGAVVIDFGTYSRPVDMKLVTAMFKFTRKWVGTPEHQQLGPVESAANAALKNDDEIHEALRRSTNPTFSHPSGTNTLAPRHLGGVVASDLLVYGTKGLSIVDASIMPLIPGTHLCATVYAVAEKAADLIKQRADDVLV